MSSSKSDSDSLNVMVGGAIVVWAIAFSTVYGPFVFGYVAMHAATTGVFLTAIRRTDRASQTRAALATGPLPAEQTPQRQSAA